MAIRESFWKLGGGAHLVDALPRLRYALLSKAFLIPMVNASVSASEILIHMVMRAEKRDGREDFCE